MSKTESSSETALETGMAAIDESKPVEHDANIVDWDGPGDPANPVNWPGSKRWAHVVIVSLLGLVTNLAPTMCAPGVDGLITDFNISSSTVSTLAVTLYVLGIAIGPMFTSPLSEVYGRLPVYHATNLVFVAFVIGCALSHNLAQFMVLRFLSGCAGGTPMAIGGGTIADLTPLAKRGFAMSLFSLGPLTGPVLGPLIGGFVAAALGWRWTFWVLAMISGFVGLIAALVMRETNPKALLERKASRLRIETGNHCLRSKLARPMTARQVIAQALFRPVMLLLRSPILLIISLYVALTFGLLYLLFTTFKDVFEGQYGFTTATSGCVYLGLGVAEVFAVGLFGSLNNKVQASRMKRDGAQKPRSEYRLILMIWFSPAVAVGLFIYGWTAYYRVHWIVPIIGTVFVGFGAFFVIMPAQLYIIDIFGSSAAASALGANILLRYISGTFLPLAGPSMYRTLNYGWGNTLLGFLALAFVPAPVLFYKYGERLRAKTELLL